MSVAEPARARSRDSAATRARIEAAALKLFARKGVDGTTIRDLALAVGVADAALYRYYASKEEIASDIFLRHYGELARAIHAIATHDWPIRRTIDALVELFCGLFDDSPDIFAFILLNQHAHLRFVKQGENVVDEISAIMARAYSRGEISVADADLAAAMALGVVLQPAVFKLYGRLGGPLRARAEALSQAAAGTIGAG
jgi:AcrR family transcriptional regulator